MNADGKRCHYLAPTGSDDNPGTRTAPWRTLAKASSDAQPGDNVILLAGVYSGVLRPLRSGTADLPITFRAAVRRTVKLIGMPDPTGYVIHLENISHVNIVGLHVRPLPAAEVSPWCDQPKTSGWLLIRQASHICIDDALMEHSRGGLAVLITESHDIRLHNSNWRDNDFNMIRIGDSHRIVIEGNAISQAGHSPLQFYPTGSARQMVVRGNVFHAGRGRPFEFFGTQDVLFEHNIITNAVNGGRSADAAAKFLVERGIFRYNRVFRNHEMPFSLWPWRPDLPCRHLRIYNNVFAGNAGAGLSILCNSPSVQDICLVNNIFAYNNPHGGGRQIKLGAKTSADAGDAAPAVTLRANAVYGKYDFPEDSAIKLSGNFEFDPEFADPDNHDHALAANSPALGAGAALTYTTGDGQGCCLPVEDAAFFYDGFGIAGEVGDLIAVGKGGQTARVTAVDHAAGTITVDRRLSWSQGDPVSPPWSGARPDVGVYEHGPGVRPSVQVLVTPFAATTNSPVHLRAKSRGLKEPVEYCWQLGDGTIANGDEVVKKYAAAADYPVRVQAVAADGLAYRGTGYVLVKEPPDAAKPLLYNDFGANDDTWWQNWRTYRPTPVAWQRIVDPGTGEGRLRVWAPEENSPLQAWAHPAGWDIESYPELYVRFSIRPGTPLGLALRTFHDSDNLLYLATTTKGAAKVQSLCPQILPDDGQWHQLRVDVRAALASHPEIRAIAGLGFLAPDVSAVQAGDGYELGVVSIS